MRGCGAPAIGLNASVVRMNKFPNPAFCGSVSGICLSLYCYKVMHHH